MEIQDIVRTLQQDATSVVFINVFLEQIGLPVPAAPTLLLAGSIAAGPGQLAEILLAAVLASLLADSLWYWLGKLFGYRVLSALCKLSINPASCVSQTEARFIRWGLASLVVAKFIPGFSTVAPPIAGALRMSLAGFLTAAALGSALWAGVALGAGWLMRGSVTEMLQVLDQHIGDAIYVGLALLAGWIGWRLWQKYRFQKFCAVPHITPDELVDAMQGEQPPLLLDLRGPTMVAQTEAIPGAVLADQNDLHKSVGDWPRNQPIVTLCACPQDAGAVQAARTLLRAGFLSVRPVAGGYDAWLAATGKAKA